MPLIGDLLLTTVSRTSSSASQWYGLTANFTFTGSNVVDTLNSSWIRTNNTFAGDCDVTYTITSDPAGGSNAEVFFYPSASDGSFVQASGSVHAGLGALAGLFGIRVTGIGTLSYIAANTAEATDTFVAGDVFKLQRVGSTWYAYKNGALARTFTATSSATERLGTGNASNNGDCDWGTVSWSGGA